MQSRGQYTKRSRPYLPNATKENLLPGHAQAPFGVDVYLLYESYVAVEWYL